VVKLNPATVKSKKANVQSLSFLSRTKLAMIIHEMDEVVIYDIEDRLIIDKIKMPDEAKGNHQPHSLLGLCKDDNEEFRLLALRNKSGIFLIDVKTHLVQKLCTAAFEWRAAYSY
jgi:uncharacterized protein YihD (DUF1040 family)